MANRSWFSPFSVPTPAPRPLEPEPNSPTEAPKARQRAPRKPQRHSGGTLATQIGGSLVALREEHGIGGLAKVVGVTPNTMVRCLSGVGLKLSTVELLAEKLGWSVVITDGDGNVVAQS